MAVRFLLLCSICSQSNMRPSLLISLALDFQSIQMAPLCFVFAFSVVVLVVWSGDFGWVGGRSFGEYKSLEFAARHPMLPSFLVSLFSLLRASRFYFNQRLFFFLFLFKFPLSSIHTTFFSTTPFAIVLLAYLTSTLYHVRPISSNEQRTPVTPVNPVTPVSPLEPRRYQNQVGS